MNQLATRHSYACGGCSVQAGCPVFWLLLKIEDCVEVVQAFWPGFEVAALASDSICCPVVA